MKTRAQHLVWILLLTAVIATAFLLRTSGLFRGLEANYTFHPDEPKQVMALTNFMEGRYVWYVGSLFYDGYPLGLNHIDEWLLRPAIALHRTLKGYFNPDTLAAVPDKTALYYWARGLRVFYSMLCLGLLALAARHLFSSRRAVLATLALFALAPLPITVSHFATGDIGANLFTLAAIVLLCLHDSRPGAFQLASSGFCVGLAFACKYNGALTGTALALYVLVPFLYDRRIVPFLRTTGTVAIGTLAGIVLGTPAFLINPHRTWQDMRANFDFIQGYNVTPDFLAKPGWERLSISLTDNTPRIIASLGWMVTILAFAGLLLAVIRLRQTRLTASPGTAPLSRAILIFSLFSFPFIALLLSLTGKPEVQPFHFAYLQAPLILAAVYSLNAIRLRVVRGGHVIAGTLLLLALFEFGVTAERDHFFWTRADNVAWKQHLAPMLQSPLSSAPQGPIKTVYLEPTSSSVFRNRAVDVTFPNADFWNRLGIAPVPGVPLSLDHDWIFPNGPVFPLNDRMFRVKRDTEATRQVVFYSEPGPVRIGVRSGSWPSHVIVNFGGKTAELHLSPNAQTLLSLKPQHWRHCAGTSAVPGGSFIVPLAVRASGGSAVLTVMTTEQEAHAFQLFGGDITDPKELLPADIPTPDTIHELANFRYLQGDEHADFTPNPRELHGYRFPTEGMVLPAGPYLLLCDIRCLTAQGNATLKLDDIHRFNELTVFEQSLALHSGLNTVTSRFAKAFAPYETQLELKVHQGQCRVESWTLIPDTGRIRMDLQQWSEGGPRPAWVGRSPKMSRHPSGVTAPTLLFGDRIRLTGLTFPRAIQQGKPVAISCVMEQDAAGLKNFQDYVVFIHLQDAAGHSVHQFHFPVWQAMTAGSLGIPLQCDGPEALPTGDYTLELGVYNARTEQRLTIAGSILSDRDRKKRRCQFGTTHLTE